MPDHARAWRPWALTIICGNPVSDGASWRWPQETAPCYQVLPPGQPGALVLSYFHLDTPAPLDAGALPPLTPAEVAMLAEVLHEKHWLILVHDDSPASLVLACRVGAQARQLGLLVMAVQTRPGVVPAALKKDLQQIVHFSCTCPADLEPLLPAQALLTSVLSRGMFGADLADLRDCLEGAGQMFWSPLPESDIARLPDAVANLPTVAACRGLLAVIALPGDPGLDSLVQVGDVLSPGCSAETTVVLSMPVVDLLPHGIYLFVC